MGLLNSILGKRSVPPQTEYIRADRAGTALDRASEIGNSIATRAGNVYKQNPKLLKTLASGALLIAVAAFAKKKGYM